MAKNIEVLLTLDTKGFNRKLKDAKGSLSSFGRQSKVTTGSLIGLASRFAAVAAPIVAVGAGFRALNKSLGVAAKFEDVQVTLTNIVGSAEGGAAALARIKDVAKELPVSFAELAASAPGLATVSGTIGELEENIRLAADIAGNFGIPFETAAGQLQRAFAGGAGAADVFREKGVLAAAGFEAGVSVSIDETIAKLREFGVEIEGSAEKLATTYSGAVNQAGDALTDFQAELGNAFKPEVTAALQKLTKAFRDNEKEILAVARAIGTNVLNAFIKFGRAIAIIIDFTRKLLTPIINLNEGLKAVGTNLPIVATAIYVVVKAQKAFRAATLAAANAFIFLQGVTGVGLVKVGAGIAAAVVTTAALTVAVDKASEAFSDSEDATDGVLGVFNDLVDASLSGGAVIRDEAEKIGDSFKELGDDAVIGLNAAGSAISTSLVKEVADALEIFKRFDSFRIPLRLNFEDEDREPIIKEIVFRNMEEFVAELKRVEKESDAFFKDINEGAIAFEFLSGSISETIITSRDYATIQKLINDLREDEIIDIAEQIRLLEALDETYADQEGLRSFLETVGQAQKALSTDLATALLEGQSAGESFQNFFKKLVTQMIADILRLKIIQPLLTGIFGLQFGSGGAVTGATGGFFGGIFGYHNGGSMMPNRPAIVGEKGPELFIPAGAGTVVANSHLQGGGGGRPNIIINAIDTASFQQRLAQDPEFIYTLTRVGARRTAG